MLKHSAQKFWLSDHMHLCLCGGQVIMLDLKHSRYRRLDGASASPLAKVVHGWPIIDPERMPESVSLEDEPLRELLHQNCLTADRARGKKALPCSVKLPSQMILFDPDVPESQLKVRSRIRLRHVLAFTAAAVWTWIQIHLCSRETTVKAVERRAARRRPVAFDMKAARELVWIYRRLTPFFYTARDACLFDSLALVHFLARFDLFPYWVFGVQDAPFSAHSWVQAEDAVFNDTALHLLEFTPIMAV